MAEIVQLTVNVHGHVQGVCFRDFVKCTATKLNLQGYVRNLPCGDIVEIEAVGEKHYLESLISNLRKGTAGSIVKSVELMWSDQVSHFDGFSIRY
jgi:acylphosphatase